MTVLTLHVCATAAVVEAAAMVVVVIDAETTTEMVDQIGIIMVETGLVHIDEQKLEQFTYRRPELMIYVLQMLLYGRLRFSGRERSREDCLKELMASLT
ncbi:hypothetical protein L1987_85987 [Smallanthus sonchifolius]|uniref:Uncharacterized protein n=1 Tax=Smallanthus sonchifolius TaxID=185202 RepID=A0ACB8XY83_9ASTR|nr:hypothetical protein L1987_85987 [Smallanthus sonchifolius]